MGEWEKLSATSDEQWDKSRESSEMQALIAPYAAGAAHNIRNWALMEKYLHAIPLDDEDGNFYRAICAVSQSKWQAARSFIAAAREQVRSNQLLFLSLTHSVD